MSANFDVQVAQQFGPFESRAQCLKLFTHLSNTPGVQNKGKMVFGGCWPTTDAAAATVPAP